MTRIHYNTVNTLQMMNFKDNYIELLLNYLLCELEQHRLYQTAENVLITQHPPPKPLHYLIYSSAEKGKASRKKGHVNKSAGLKYQEAAPP